MYTKIFTPCEDNDKDLSKTILVSSVHNEHWESCTHPRAGYRDEGKKNQTTSMLNQQSIWHTKNTAFAILSNKIKNISGFLVEDTLQRYSHFSCKGSPLTKSPRWNSILHSLYITQWLTSVAQSRHVASRPLVEGLCFCAHQLYPVPAKSMLNLFLSLLLTDLHAIKIIQLDIT